MFSVETVDPAVLQSPLGEGVVSSEGGRQHWVDHKCKNIQTVQQTFFDRTLTKRTSLILLQNLRGILHPNSYPHIKRVSHANKSKEKEDPNGFEEVTVERKVQRWWE